MNEDLVAQAVQIERDATEMLREIQRRSEDLVAEANQDAEVVRETTLRSAHRQADEMLASAKSAADAERVDIIGKAEEEVARMASLAARHRDAAVSLVVDRLLGRE